MKNGNGKPTCCVLYARFSPRPNADECESCAVQLRDLRKYARVHGYEIVGEFSDEALSGGDDWQDRPGMFDAAQACKRGYLFVVRSFDRLFRDTRKALVFAGMLEQKGVEIRSITEEAASLNTPEAKLMRGIFLLVAEYQREMIRARTRAKMLDHQANGRRMSKIPPFGTKIDPNDSARLIPDPAEQATIATIRRLHKRGLGQREIARRLTASGADRRGRTDWSHVLVGRILRREGVS